MGDPTNHPRIGGDSVRIGDCCIWAEIRYLDSPTYYREYLPPNTIHPRQTLDHDLVMLDPSSKPLKFTAKLWGLWLALLSFPLMIWFLLELAENW